MESAAAFGSSRSRSELGWLQSQERKFEADGGLCTQQCGVGGFLCNCDRSLHVAGLDSGSTSGVSGRLFASLPEQNGRDSQAASENDKPKRKESDRVARGALPEGFALLSLVVFFFSGLMALLFFSIGRSVSRLPSQYTDPTHCPNEES